MFFSFGLFLACLIGFAIAEVYVRFFPPSDIYPFLGEQTPLKGNYVSDKDFGVGFASFEVLRANNPHAFGPSVSLTDGKYTNTWACFGNSFVHGTGNLVDTIRSNVPSQPVFKLDWAESILGRFAQIKTLLENGFHPERILMALMPVDVGSLGKQSLDSILVTSAGALTYKPRMPPSLLGLLAEHSRFIFTAWVRTGWNQTDRGYSASGLYDRVDKRLQSDFRKLFTSLGFLSQKHDVPVTLIFIPRSRQARGKSGFAFQDVLVRMAREAGIDAVDPREAFLSAPNPARLYVSDGHLSMPGNKMLLEELLRHLDNNAINKVDDEGEKQ